MHSSPEQPWSSLEGIPYWPWHTGLYVGDGQVLHPAPGATVREQPLEEIRFDALLATRLP